MREKILQIDDADQPVERSFTDGIASVRLLTNEVADLIHRHIHIEPCDVAAVGHDRLHAAVTQREDTADDLLLDSLHSSVLGAFLHDRLDLGLRYGTVGIAQPEQTGNALDALRKEPYEREATTDSTFIGPATSLATGSAAVIPIRLGINSPNTIVR